MPNRICPYCGETHQLDAQFCPNTGNSLDIPLAEDDRSQRKKWPWVFIVVFMLFAVGVALGILGGRRQQSSGMSPHRVTVTSDRRVTRSPNFVTATPHQVIAATATPLITTAVYPTSTATRTATPRPTLTRTATVTDDSWRACQNTYSSRLHIGDRAYVSFDPPLPNNVRENPKMSADVIGQIDIGEEILILEGPSCSNNWVWWLVRSRKTGLVGWTSEGDIEDYWLIPLPED
jgi:hypothetical protein